MNLQLVTGRRGLQVCVDFLELLRASPDQEENQWNAEVNLDHDSTVPSVLMAMCDAFRRLHVCFSGLPWQLFHVAEMDAEAGIAHMRHLRQSCGGCRACRDRLFAEVSRQHLSSPLLSGPVRAGLCRRFACFSLWPYPTLGLRIPESWQDPCA